MEHNENRGWGVETQFIRSIISPEEKYLEHIAIFNHRIVACGEGNFFYWRKDSWINGHGVNTSDNKTLDVSVHGKTLVVLKEREGSIGELQICDSAQKSKRKVNLLLGAESSTMLLTRHNNEELFYISNQAEKVVHQLDRNGKLIRNYGEDVLKYPFAMAVDFQGDLIVSDWLLNDVIIFNCNGSVKRRLGSKTNFPSEVEFFPYAITVDEKGFIFVTSWRSSDIFVFTPNGDKIQRFLSKINGLDEPTSIATAVGGNMVVVNSHGTEIRCYKYRIAANVN